MITTTVNFDEFWTWLKKTERTNFSYEGAKALFEYLDDLSDDLGENIEYDPVAWCVEYTEYENLDELKESYNDIESMEDLHDKTLVVSESPLIIQDF